VCFDEPVFVALLRRVSRLLIFRNNIRKKAAITKGGPNKLQVFLDFENVMTKFRNDDGGRPACASVLVNAIIVIKRLVRTERSYSTADMLESSTALLPQVCAVIDY
jgi:hypothetical protein